MRIVVGSQRAYKLEAARFACALLFPNDDIRVHGVSVDSGVSAQPMSNTESITGARNRAVSARSSAPQGCGYAIGIENGLVAVDDQWFATTWIVVVNSAGEEGIASTLLRPVPDSIMNLAQQGHELSGAIQIQFGSMKSTNEEGLIGLITQGILQKHRVLSDGIITAFAPLVNRKAYTHQ